MMKQKKSVVVIAGLILLLALVACGGGEEVEAPPAVQTVIVVATPTAADNAAVAAETANTDTESAPVADAPVMEMPEVSSGEPMMTAVVDLNVRTGPGTQYPAVGVLRAGSSAHVVGKTSNGYWWKIDCPSGAGAECWSSAGSQYSTSANTESVAVAAIPPAPATATSSSSTSPTYTPDPYATTEATDTPDPYATTEATYTPDPYATTEATYTPDPYATTEATHTPDPYATATYTPEATATTTTSPIADFDNDSLQNPAQDIFLRITGTRSFSHTDYVSNPDGDNEDWVQFEFPNNSNSSQQVWITLNCTVTGDPNAQLRVNVWEDGQQTNKVVFCGQGETALTVDNTKVQQLQVHFSGLTGNAVYASYDLIVVGYK